MNKKYYNEYIKYKNKYKKLRLYSNSSLSKNFPKHLWKKINSDKNKLKQIKNYLIYILGDDIDNTIDQAIENNDYNTFKSILDNLTNEQLSTIKNNEI